VTALEKDRKIGVVGAGTMGAGIAQLAAAAGHEVLLLDAAPGAAEAGKRRLGADLGRLVARGRMPQAEADALLGRITVADGVDGLAGAALVVEAIVENLDVKRRLFAELEARLAADAILATNTSSISVTAIARDLKHPERVVGMHFFNPAPVMKLVEVVSGVATARDAAERVFATAEAWGKVAVHAKSTPGFIVNRVARPFYAEALRLHEEGVADPATLDALVTGGGGFRMGPFELMDLIGNDVNYAVTVSVFESYYGDPRFRPSNLQLELVNAGRLGRKSGRGFYDHAEGAARPAPATVEPGGEPPLQDLDLSGAGTEAEGVAILLTDGRTARRAAAEQGRPVILHDLVPAHGAGARLGFTASADVPPAVLARFVAALHARGIAATRLPDWPGLVVMRTLAMLANEGFEAVLQGVADEAGVDAAMRFGVNYPRGPIGWARSVGLPTILSVLDHLQSLTGDPRYRASLGLRIAAEA
jgi:3-hydroxybutyryl-CoA dehydrogenase